MLKVSRSYSDFDELYYAEAYRGKTVKFELTEMADGESLASDEVGIRLTSIINKERIVRVQRSVNGKNVFVSVTLAPGKTYAVSKSEDVFINAIRKKQDVSRLSMDAKSDLDAKGIKYEEHKGCGSCGSKGTLSYPLVEVIE